MQDTRTSAKQRSGCFAEVREGFYVMESKFLLTKAQASPSRRAPAATAMQSSTPHRVGSRAASAVQPQERVSLKMVRQVVEQGKCSREKSMVQSAVRAVQPLAARMPRSSSSEPVSCSVPVPR